MSAILYGLLILATSGERLYELSVSKRNAVAAFARGGIEYGRRHFPWMIVLHTGLLLACIGEVLLVRRPFIPELGWPMLVVVLLCQLGRYRIIHLLGSQWNTRVIVVPGTARVSRGPYRWAWLAHPNYLIVAVEGVALPLVHTAWVTAVLFTILNAVLLLGFRIPEENRALRQLV
ncbi:MAG: isoprenylcysteine carboxyl methyltransferase family protein [Rhodoglobus sp.]